MLYIVSSNIVQILTHCFFVLIIVSVFVALDVIIVAPTTAPDTSCDIAFRRKYSDEDVFLEGRYEILFLVDVVHHYSLMHCRLRF